MKSFTVLIMCLTFLSAQSQNKVINGNGKRVTKERVTKTFDQLEIDMYCDVIVEIGSMPMVQIQADKNVIDKISVEQESGKLTIKMKEGFWLQSTRPSIYLQTPYLKKLTTYGSQTNIGNVHINGIDVDNFEVDLLYGDVVLSGKANQLVINSSNQSYYNNKSTLDASQLEVLYADATIKGSNTVSVSASQSLKVNLQHDASLSYFGKPESIELKGKAIQSGPQTISVSIDNDKVVKSNYLSPKVQLQYIELKVRNNSNGRNHFVIKGPNPSGRNFSYGFPMMPYATRTKKVPVGTKIFLQSASPFNKKLITISASDEGQVVDLFTK